MLPSAVRVQSLLLVLLSFLALLLVGGQLTLHLGLLGIALAEAGLVALPAWAWLRLNDVPREAWLGRARPSALLGGALAGLGGGYLVAVVEQTLLERVLPLPPELRDELSRLVGPSGGPLRLCGQLLALAVAPALAEELLFRGAVLTAWRRGPSRTTLRSDLTAALVAALSFGAFHGSLYRFLPASALGFLLGLVRLAGGSLWPAVAFHLANNLAVVLAVRAGHEDPLPLGNAIGITFFVAAVASLTVGLWLTRVGSQRT